MKPVFAVWGLGIILFGVSTIGAFHPPAEERFALRGPNGSSILPGGRIIQPAGRQFPTGPGPLQLAVSSSGKLVATANFGPERASVTVAEVDKKGVWTIHSLFASVQGPAGSDFEAVFSLAFDGEKRLWISEGQSGRVRLMDVESGSRKKIFDLNRGRLTESFAGSLAYDWKQAILYVLDPVHSRLVVVDGDTAEQIGSIALDFPPHCLSLSANGHTVWVAGAFLAQIDVSNPHRPIEVGRVALASPRDAASVLATAADVYVSHSESDTIDVIDVQTKALQATISITVPGLEKFRGVTPRGMAFDPTRNWLLVAEAGINAVGVIDVAKNRILGHIPVGWYPDSVGLRQGEILVANLKGRGTGPSSALIQPDSLDFAGVFRRGSVSHFPFFNDTELQKQTQIVFAANGLLPRPEATPPKLPVRHVVVILKQGRTFDEILGDLKHADGRAEGSPRLARFGAEGYASGGSGRFSLQRVNITPNQHALAERFAFSDNFYSDGDSPSEGDSWFTGVDSALPAPYATERPRSSGLEHFLQSNGVSFQQFGDDSLASTGVSTPDQHRADQFISEIEAKYGKPGVDLPGFLVVRLPNDRTGNPRPQDGYPYTASFVADNDLAVGKIVDYLSHSRWWPEMAVFVTESDAEGGRDHVDAHRTVLIGIGPNVKPGFVSHVNASFPALHKAIFRLLGLPPMNLFDATASDLMGLFREESDLRPFSAIEVDSHLFEARRPSR